MPIVYIWSFTAILALILCALIANNGDGDFCILGMIALLIQWALWNVGFWICHSWSWTLLGFSSLFFGLGIAFMLFLMVMDQ